jgi:hypothetical protein
MGSAEVVRGIAMTLTPPVAGGANITGTGAMMARLTGAAS